MQVTFESTEPVEQVAAVLSALYQVPITTGPAADSPEVVPLTQVSSEKTAAATTATAKKPATPKKAAEVAKAATAGRSRRAGRASAAPVDAAAVRVWARHHGITVSAHGALSDNVLTAYRTATA